MTNREEVAERLRMYATDFDFGDSNLLWYVEKAVFDDIRIRESGRVFASLADLIDPTCTADIKREDNGIDAQPYYTSSCGNCGALWDTITGAALLPKYCPHCGARVVR